jgi:hypothetical protein
VPLPAGWAVGISREHGGVYFYHVESGDSTFELAEVPVVAARVAARVVARVAARVTARREVLAGWEVVASRRTGEAYYVNTLTGESTFDRPTAPTACPSAPSAGAASLQAIQRVQALQRGKSGRRWAAVVKDPPPSTPPPPDPGTLAAGRPFGAQPSTQVVVQAEDVSDRVYLVDPMVAHGDLSRRVRCSLPHSRTWILAWGLVD